MGYNYTESAIKRVKSFLDEMVESDRDLSWAVANSAEPSKVAYLIRQGIKAATTLGLNTYAELAGKYIIRTKPNMVVAEIRSKLPEQIFKETVSKLVVREPTDLTSIVGAIVKHNTDEMYFPNAVLDDIAMSNLHYWATAKDYVVIKNEEGVTVSRKEEAKELAWSPPS